MRVEKLEIKLEGKTLVNIAFEIKSSLALVGQSGSGKSLTLKALLQMLPSTMQVNMQHKSDFVLSRGDNIGFVPQNPFTALSPLTKIKKQFFVELHEVKELFHFVGLDEELLERFPPELSGGQLQRVVIAIALSTKPKLLLLDEPTTALDPQTRVVIIELLKNLQKTLGYKMLFVTHDMKSAESLCEEIAVIKEGIIVESGTMQDILAAPSSDYTKTLIEANFAHRQYRK